MKPATKLKHIDTSLAKANQKIAELRTKVKELSEERDVIAREVEKAERLAAFARVQKAGRKWQAAHPEEHEAFMEAARIRNQEDVIEGFLDGWWDLDEDGNMAAPAQVFHLSDFAEVNNPLMAHVMAKAGIFPSVGQARKNGWNKPLTTGSWSVTKKKIRIRVEE